MSCPPISVGSVLLIFVVNVAGSAAKVDDGEVEVVAAVAEERSEVEATEEGAGTVEVNVAMGDASDVVVAEVQVVGTGPTPTVEIVGTVDLESVGGTESRSGEVEVSVTIDVDGSAAATGEVEILGMPTFPTGAEHVTWAELKRRQSNGR